MNVYKNGEKLMADDNTPDSAEQNELRAAQQAAVLPGPEATLAAKNAAPVYDADGNLIGTVGDVAPVDD